MEAIKRATSFTLYYFKSLYLYAALEVHNIATFLNFSIIIIGNIVGY